jgi:phage terminase large subunit
MAEYYVMLERKYELPVEQFVIYLGESRPHMAAYLDSRHMKFNFPLIWFADLDYTIFLSSERPEEVVLGILADFKGNSPEKVLEQIIRRIEETAVGDFPLRRYFRQLRVLAQLRNLEQNLKDLAMDSIAKFVSMERDAAYMVGLDIGEEKAEERIVRNLLAKMSLSSEQIADIVGVSVEFVESVKQKIS